MKKPHKYREDISGQKFGEWLVLAPLGFSYWLCRCVCGREKGVYISDLRRGLSTGCAACRQIAGLNNRIHGGKHTRLHRIWTMMKSRCTNKKLKAYRDYGGRGISVCSEWSNSFVAFESWALANGYAAHLTLDRQDNNLGYSPDNCRWASWFEQARNRRKETRYLLDGKLLLLCELAEKSGINRSTIQRRLKQGWPVERAISVPVQPSTRWHPCL